MKRLGTLFLSVAFALTGLSALAAWTYDETAKTLSDGTWEFTNVSVVTVNGVKGLSLSSKTTYTSSDESVLDFTGGATVSGSATVYAIVACEKNQIFSGKTTLTQFIAPDMTKVSSQMCQSCTALKKVVLSPNFATGSSNVFLGCTALDDFSPLEFTVVTTSLGNYFFNGCTALGGVLKLPNATEIGESQLTSTAFTEVYAPKAVTVKKNAMKGMTKVSKITISGTGGAYDNAIYTANATGPVSIYWLGTAVPAMGGNMIRNTDTYYPRIYCRATAMEAWLAFATATYTSPSYCLRLAADFGNSKYKDNERTDYPGDGVAEAVLKDAFSKWCYFWLCNWEYDEPTVSVSIAVPDHVEVARVLWNEDVVKAKGGYYKVPTTGALTITYHVTDGMTFEDGTTEYVVSGVTPAATIPASVCDKKVVSSVPHNVSVDLAPLAARNMVAAELACGSDFTCVTNGTVVTWTVPGGVAFAMTYAAEEAYYFAGNAPTKTVNYASGVSADIVIDVATLEAPVRAADKWEVVEEDKQKYLQNLGKVWKLYVTESSAGYTIYRALDTAVTAVVRAPSDGILDLTDVEEDTGKPVVGVGYAAFNDAHTMKNAWKLTKFVGPKVTSVGTWAFKGSASLGEVEISPKANSIFNEQSFSDCTSLTNFTPTVFPNVTTVGKASFDNVPVGGDWVLAGVTKVNKRLFYKNANPNGFSLSLPNLTEITGGDAAYFCAQSTITNFSAPKLVTIESGMSFQNCRRLTKVVFADDVASIAYNTFNGCSALTDFSPMNLRALKTLGYNAFDGIGLAGPFAPRTHLVAACGLLQCDQPDIRFGAEGPDRRTEERVPKLCGADERRCRRLLQ